MIIINQDALITKIELLRETTLYDVRINHNPEHLVDWVKGYNTAIEDVLDIIQQAQLYVPMS
jgi:hypothetical protein